MSFATPAEVLARRSQFILDGDADGFAGLFAPDAVIEAPFAGRSGMPARQEGRETIRAYARQVLASPLRIEGFSVTSLHETSDPEVVIAEVAAKGTVATTGRSFTATSVQILRIRDGQIVSFRDFADPRGLEDVVGEPRPGAFARVNAVQMTADKLAGLVQFSSDGLATIRETPGFAGFYLLADRSDGKVITISLWDSEDSLRQHEARAVRMRAEAESAAGVASPPVEVYEVLLQV
jgi:uncharacterized protein